MGLQEGLWCDVEPVTQSGSLDLRCYHQAVRHFCILGMVAWLSDGQCQEETKQESNISLLGDKRSYAHYSHECCGTTYLPLPTGAGASE